MTNIDRNLLPDERIIFRTKKHLIIFFMPFVLTLMAVYAFYYMQSNPVLTRLDWAPWFIVLLIWGQAALDWITSDFVITNKRVMMREGFFYVHANELRIKAIAQVNVGQSLFGQLLGYGTVSINAFGAYDAYSMIAHALVFRKYVNEELDKLSP